MAQQRLNARDDAVTTGTNNSDDKSEPNSQLLQIHTMLLNHDDDKRISRQVNQFLIDDGLTLELVSHFDEKSLQEMIDSWNINTYDKKAFLIRGLLTSGMKKYRNDVSRNELNRGKTGM